MEHGEATGRSIIYENIPPEIYEKEKASQGWPRTSIDTLLALFADIRAGINRDSVVISTVENVTGRAAFSFRKFARDYVTTPPGADVPGGAAVSLGLTQDVILGRSSKVKILAIHVNGASPLERVLRG